MKRNKIISLLGALLLTISLFSCRNNEVIIDEPQNKNEIDPISVSSSQKSIDSSDSTNNNSSSTDSSLSSSDISSSSLNGESTRRENIQFNQWAYEDGYGSYINAAKEIANEDSVVKIAIIDTGISPLGQKYLGNSFNEVEVIDENIMTDDVIHFINDDHALNIASIITGKGFGDLGFYGIADNVEFYSIKIRYDETKGNAVFEDVVKAIEWCNFFDGIDIISFSGGFYAGDLSFYQMESLFNAISSFNGLFVVASGNDDTNFENLNSFYRTYPTCFSSNYEQTPRIIAVGSSNALGEKASHSNYGRNDITIFAPREEISTIFTNENEPFIATNSGTSIAVAFVTGTAALLKSINIYLSAEDIKNIICQTVTPFAAGKNYDLCTSGGIINAYEAVNYVNNL